jgi:hypothetical protein
MRAMYDTCIDMEAINNAGLDPIGDLLGDYPYLGSDKVDASFSWETMAGENSR